MLAPAPTLPTAPLDTDTSAGVQSTATRQGRYARGAKIPVDGHTKGGIHGWRVKLLVMASCVEGVLVS